MVKKRLKVRIPCGIHLKPAGILANAASKYDAYSYIQYKNNNINAKSVLNLVACGILAGDEVTLQCTGRDESKAIIAMQTVLQDESIRA
ncbi:MAG: HPr family phosphocarrier protein [Lachnospiraceae bacterium]